MVVVIQRMIQKLYPGKWDELNKINAKFDDIEAKYGFPQNKKRLRCLFGEVGANSIVIEFEWPSLSKMEKAMTKAYLDPEYQKLTEKLDSIIISATTEIYTPVITFEDLQTEG
ncbi:MAG: hypothetical protein ACFE8N_10645 [Promethearchaeota archaeon]